MTNRVISLQSIGRIDTTELVVTGLGLVAGIVLLTTAILLYNGQRDRLRNSVARARPGATILPAFAESPPGLAGMAPTPLVLAVLEDRVEIWTGRRQANGYIPRAGADVRVRGVRAGGTVHTGICITNGAHSVSFVPHYSALISTRGLERALRDLGEDPAHHLGR